MIVVIITIIKLITVIAIAMVVILVIVSKNNTRFSGLLCIICHTMSFCVTTSHIISCILMLLSIWWVVKYAFEVKPCHVMLHRVEFCNGIFRFIQFVKLCKTLHLVYQECVI